MRHEPIIRRLLAWFSANARDLPWRRTRDPYAIWVSEIMLQQTQVKTVIPYWQRWMSQLPTIRSLAEAQPGRLHKLWEGLGYYTRVRNMQKAARVIMNDHGGDFPDEFEKVLDLPGIGRYTAGAICSIAFNQPSPVLDGNVIRVLTRIFGIAGNPREAETNAKLWLLAEELVGGAVAMPFPKGRNPSARSSRGPVKAKEQLRASHLNQALMELGALVCTARQAQCMACPVATFCEARIQNRVQELPALHPRKPATRRHFVAFIVEARGRLFVRQRPAGAVNAFLWEFPNIEIASQKANLQEAAEKELGVLPVLDHFCSIRHTITRFRITLEVFRASFQNGALPQALDGARWLSPRALERLPFSSAHKKILLKLRARGDGEVEARPLQGGGPLMCAGKR